MKKTLPLLFAYQDFIDGIPDEIERLEKEYLALDEKRKEQFQKVLRKSKSLLSYFGFDPEEKNPYSLYIWKRILTTVKESGEKKANHLIPILSNYHDILVELNELQKAKENFEEWKSMGSFEYKKHLRKYFNVISRFLLQGYSYKMPKITTMYIRAKKLKDPCEIIDYQATNKNKEELLKAGLKPYNREEAELYKSKGIPYDGKRYVVYKNVDKFNILTFRRFDKQNDILIDYTPMTSLLYGDEINKKTNEVVKKVNSPEDIYDMVGNIKRKLSLLIKCYPEKQSLFIRNEQYHNLQYRKNNSQNRQ